MSHETVETLRARVHALEQERMALLETQVKKFAELADARYVIEDLRERIASLEQERERIRQAVDKIRTELGAQTDMLAGFVEIHPEMSGAELSAVVQASTVTSILGLDELLKYLQPAGEREER